MLGRDGGTIQAQVADDDGKPSADCNVLIFPGQPASMEELAAVLISGQTDQNGSYTSGLLPPGKYYVVASADRVYKRPESIASLWQARARSALEVDVPAKGSVRITVKPCTWN
jgi:hypothetical protein